MIEINNLTTLKIDEAFIEKIIEQVLKGEAREKAMISIAFLGPGRMRKLNKMYRQKNRVTDVLSFASGKVPFGQFKIGKLQKAEGLGEVIICPREVKKNSQENNREFITELAWVAIHGVLHLLGYNHEASLGEAKKMAGKEEAYLKILNYKI